MFGHSRGGMLVHKKSTISQACSSISIQDYSVRENNIFIEQIEDKKESKESYFEQKMIEKSEKASPKNNLTACLCKNGQISMKHDKFHS